MPITRQMVKEAQRIAKASRQRDRAALKNNRAWWKALRAKYQPKRKRSKQP